jgi:copper chaperone
MSTSSFNITGMTCDGCTSAVTRALKAVAGVSEVTVALTTSDATVTYDEHRASPAQLKAAVVAAGYGVDAGPSVPAAAQAHRSCC